MAATRQTYLHGHHDSVLRSHRWRTAENSAAYALPWLAPGRQLRVRGPAEAVDPDPGQGARTERLPSDLVEAAGIKPGPDVRRQVRRAAMAGPDDGAAGCAYRRRRGHRAPDALIADVAED